MTKTTELYNLAVRSGLMALRTTDITSVHCCHRRNIYNFIHHHIVAKKTRSSAIAERLPMLRVIDYFTKSLKVT